MQLGGPPSGAGTLNADGGEIQPADPSKFYKEPGYSPYAGRRYPERPYFGDEHVHTAWSVDAGGSGATLGPEEATRFARGEEVTSTSGQPVKLGQPLDWVAITDHSDMMGMITEIKGGNPEMMADPTLKRWRDMFNGGPVEAKKAVMELVAAQSNKKLPPAATDPKFAKSVWAKTTTIAEKYNEPGRFTAFIAYEWTSNAGGGDNLHRNIIYRDNKDKADQVLPYTTFQSENPEDLWKWMTEWEKTTGGKILAIPHNGNLSNGRMFALTTFSGDPLTKAWADARQRWEPLFEAIQMKGQSESHPSLSTTDDFAAYELWDRGNLTQTPKKPGMIAGEYAREALKNGLKVEQDLGTNPFKFGMAGGTDTHNGLVAAEEDNFFAKFPSAEPRPDRWDEDAMNFGPNRIVKGWEMTAAGYTAVWATGNTRAELWDAMMRRETYATSGPRMIVRFFGGYDFTQADATRTPAVAGYAKGVPMGGDLAGGAIRQGADVPRRRAQGPVQRQPRSHPDHQGMAGQGRQAAGEDLRRGVGRQGPAQDRQRQADPGREYRGRRHRDVDQHHRRSGTRRRVEGPGLRSVGPRGLLRAHPRDPDAALDRVRRGVLQDQDHRPESTDDDAGAGVHVANLVFAEVRVHMRIRTLLGEPMLHFLLIGIALFAAYQWMAPVDSDGRRIVITQGVVDDLVTQHVAAKGREPSSTELNHLIESYVRDEILYREGVKLGLDRDDIVVKRRVRQKIELIEEEDASTRTPTDADLSAYLAANPARFVQPAILTFEQVFLGQSAAGPGVVHAVAVTHQALRNGADPAELGTPTLLPHRMTRTPADLVARDFGASFAAALEKVPVGEWVGPIDSSFGAHYVRVSDRTPAVAPQLAAVRDHVVREWENERRQRARNDAYAKMRGGYEVSIEANTPAERR